MIYFCPTPIGNLGDITIRVEEVLRTCDEIYAEDTRTSAKLMNHLKIKKPMFSYHKFNEKKAAEEILKKVDKNIAVISDAGMPGISDPGNSLIRLLIENEIEYTVLPGPCAFVVALVASGFDNDFFSFRGFLDPKSQRRRKELENLKNLESTLIFYEAPHRILEFLKDMREIFGKRRIFIGRELSKTFEDYIHTDLDQVLEEGFLTLKGEFVIVVEKNLEEKVYDLDELLKEKLSEGMSKSEAVKILAKEYGISKNDLYKKSLELK
ncbi:16S rRNA (cytidine(1402)-2'-O)-methyltransferase [Peptoniphilus sp. GNH]|nr:S-adenosylmethionine-dependent methyltransferase, YraL family [Clostridiales bacterium KA00134]UHR02716.1 16S rRNA (cytidine(1402)-2'-O)-methyltransferase [Peptoniphilus sp. GNH]